MWVYLVKRTLLIFVTLFGICMISFVLAALAPGDPAATAAGIPMIGTTKGRANDEVLKHVRKALYLDRPVILNFSPNNRTKLAKQLVKDVCEGGEYARLDAQDSITGNVGTAVLDVLIPEAQARAAVAEDQVAKLRAALAKLEPLSAQEQPDANATTQAIQGIEALVNGRGPRFSKKATASDRARGWVAWAKEHENEPARGVGALLDVLDKVVPAKAGGPTPRGTVVERANAWTKWWETHAKDYSSEVVEKAVLAYLDAPAAERPAKLAELEKLGGAATATIVRELQSSSGERRRAAAFAMSLVAHKPWDLTPKPEAIPVLEKEWEQSHSKLKKDLWVAKAITKDLADQERSIARWWFRSEEEFVDFSFARQVARAFTQTQFGNWFRALALGFDFGKSFSYKKDVKDLIIERLPVTLWLNFFSLFFTYVIAIPIGVFSATHPRSLADRVSTFALFILYSLPSFWVGAILILLFTGPPIGVSWFPSHGIESIDSWKLSTGQLLWDRILHAVLPITCLTYGGIAYISRQMRAGMLETIRQDYIRTARAKGLSENVVIFKHAMRNSMIPILTILGYLLPYMFGGSVIIESIFSIDGLGMLMFDAILKRDIPLIMTEVFISGLLTLFGILVADISYAIVDPRIDLK